MSVDTLIAAPPFILTVNSVKMAFVSFLRFLRLASNAKLKFAMISVFVFFGLFIFYSFINII